MSSDYEMDGFDPRILAENLQSLRGAKRKTQEEVARETKLSFGSIKKYESGSTAPGIGAACILADYFGVSLDYLCGRKDHVA